MNSRIFILLLFILGAFLPFQIHAQGIPASDNGVDIISSAVNPSPGQKFTLKAQSFTANLDSATITWKVNGKVVLTGVGEVSLPMIAPDLGKKTTISVTAVTAEKVTLANSYTFSAGSVDLIIENSGFIPAYFQGKLPTSYQNTVKVIAMPHLATADGKEYDPKDLVYLWKKNSRVIQDQSGYGKQAVTIVGDIVPRAFTLTVTVTTKDSSLSADGYIQVPFNSPSLSFYVDDPLYGPLYNSAISDNLYIGAQKETGVLAVPFGFNKPDSGLGNLTLSWMINGYEYPDLSSNQSIILRAPDGADGSSNIRLDIRNSKDILQNAITSFSARFRASDSSSADNVTTL